MKLMKLYKDSVYKTKVVILNIFRNNIYFRY